MVLHYRSRVDFVTHLIGTYLIPKFENDYELLSSGLKKPYWFEDFGKEWRMLSERSSNRSYSTDFLNWKCTCPSFLMSRFVVCRHLISGSAVPSCRDLVRSRHSPFSCFTVSERTGYLPIWSRAEKSLEEKSTIPNQCPMRSCIRLFADLFQCATPPTAFLL